MNLIKSFGEDIINEADSFIQIRKKFVFFYKDIHCEIDICTSKGIIGASDTINGYTLDDISWNIRGFYICAYIYIHSSYTPDLLTYLIAFSDENINMKGEITFREETYDKQGDLIKLQIGVDYQHCYNTGKETLEEIQEDLRASVDIILNDFNNRRK